jgi:GNAT superfamily N-acetyltransferase
MSGLDALDYLLREADDGDVGFVVDGWVHEMRHSPWSRYEDNRDYTAGQHELIHRLLPSSRCLIACDRDNPEHDFGCVVFLASGGALALHWLYVKGAYRRLGLGRALLLAAKEDAGAAPDAEVACTQATKLFEDQALTERYRLRYSPHLLLGIPLPGRAVNETAPREQMAG